MYRSFKCCCYCYQDLESIDGDLANLWTNLCDTCLDNRGFIVFKRKNDIQQELDELEDLGFITSHETDNSLIARVEGLMIDEEFMPAFCINYDDHSELPEVQ